MQDVTKNIESAEKETVGTVESPEVFTQRLHCLETGADRDLDEIMRMIRQSCDTIWDKQTHTKSLYSLSMALGKRHGNTKAMADLEDAIRIAREVVEATRSDDPEQACRLSHLGCLLENRYDKTRVMADLDDAIDEARRVLIKAPPNSFSDRLTWLRNFADRLRKRYKITGTMCDLEEGVQITRTAIALVPDTHLGLAAWLNNLAVLLRILYERTEETANLEESIRTARQAVSTPNNPDPASALNSLGSGLSVRYKRTGAMADLDESIQISRRAVQEVPSKSYLRAGFLSNLGTRLGDRFRKMGNITDLDKAIEILRGVVKTTPLNDPHRATFLHNLGIRLHDRYQRTGGTADLDEWIQIATKTYESIPETHPNRVTYIYNLGLALGKRYERTWSTVDLEEAIRIMKQGVDTTPHSHQKRGGLLLSLGIRLGERFRRTGMRADLEEAIAIARQVIDATPSDHPDRGRRLHNLGIRLRHQYQFGGMMTDLEEAIRLSREAVKANFLSHLDRAGQLNALGIHLGLRYERTGAIADLDESIQIASQAAQEVPLGHPYYPGLLNSLSIRLGDRYLRTKARTDLNEAVCVIRKAVEVTPKDHPEREGRLNTLAIHLGFLYHETGAIDSLEESIRISREVVNKTPHDYADRAGRLHTLATQLGDWHRKTQEPSDLEAAIIMAIQAVESTPNKHPDRAKRLNDLGALLLDRYRTTKVKAKLREADLGEATKLFQSALSQDNAPTMVRLQSGLKLLDTCSRSQELFEGLSLAVNLIPRLTLRSLETADKQHVLGQIAGLASSAAAAALQVEKSPYVALSLLEQGRGVLGASLEGMRTDIHDLYEENRELAERFDFLRSELESPIIRNDPSLDEDDGLPLQGGGTDRRYDAGIEIEALIHKVRQLPGFEGFLSPPSEPDIRDAASNGPIAIINVSKQRCDTIIVEQNRIWFLPLQDLSKEGIDEMAQDYNLGRMGVLKWLWDVITSPVLNALGFNQPLKDVSLPDWPHLWWIPTGALTKFPLHASGYHKAGFFDTVLDHVISSYNSSVRAIISGRRRSKAPPCPTRMLLVAMEHTPERQTLPSVRGEITRVCDIFASETLETIPLQQPRKSDVVDHLRSCTVFHFAGHGSTHKSDPAKSHICLEDWKENPLTVANLLEMNLHQHSPFLAYLSACGTGRIRDEKFYDESIHLINACQVAGFRHVIGTLWNVNDRLCMDMASITYQEMMRKGMDDDSVARGLHVATRKLRDGWLQPEGEVGPKPHGGSSSRYHGVSLVINGGMDQAPRKGSVCESEDEDETPNGPPLWIPYVHFGV